MDKPHSHAEQLLQACRAAYRQMNNLVMKRTVDPEDPTLKLLREVILAATPDGEDPRMGIMEPPPDWRKYTDAD